MTGRRVRRLLLALFAGCLAGEVGLRLWAHFHGATGSLYDYVVVTGHRFKMRPDSTVIVPERYGDIHYSFNHQGYRDVDHDPARAGRRLLWLGDSVTFGLGVAQDCIYAARVGRLLPTARPAWESVNLAIFAYDTRHELETLAEDGLALRPQVILLQFYMNDLSLAPQDPDAQPASWSDRVRALRNRLLYGSALYLRVQQSALRAGYFLLHDPRRRFSPETLKSDEPRADVAYLAAHPDDGSIPTFAALAAIAAMARQHRARLLVFVVKRVAASTLGPMDPAANL